MTELRGRPENDYVLNDIKDLDKHLKVIQTAQIRSNIMFLCIDKWIGKDVLYNISIFIYSATVMLFFDWSFHFNKITETFLLVMC